MPGGGRVQQEAAKDSQDQTADSMLRSLNLEEEVIIEVMGFGVQPCSDPQQCLWSWQGGLRGEEAGGQGDMPAQNLRSLVLDHETLRSLFKHPLTYFQHLQSFC